ncbi:MAG TPA: hypothetical protein VMW36_09215 [Patescibacteria group bacterium]|nr:hypothetical protein [Patescibacteria group bacterium]
MKHWKFCNLSSDHFKQETEIETTAKKRRILTVIAASIILIFLTSIATILIMWFTPLDTSPITTEHIFITDVKFPSGGSGTWIYIIANNTGNMPVTIHESLVNRRLESVTNPTLPSTIQPNSGLGLNITVTSGVTAGHSYLLELRSAKGNPFVYVATAGN